MLSGYKLKSIIFIFTWSSGGLILVTNLLVECIQTLYQLSWSYKSCTQPFFQLNYRIISYLGRQWNQSLRLEEWRLEPMNQCISRMNSDTLSTELKLQTMHKTFFNYLIWLSHMGRLKTKKHHQAISMRKNWWTNNAFTNKD